MLEPPWPRSRAHQYVHILMWHGLRLSLLHGNSVQLLLLLAGRFHPFHGQWALPLVCHSSPPTKDPKSSIPSSPNVSSVYRSDAAYFTVKTHKGKSKENSPVTSMHISSIKFKDFILNKERLKRSIKPHIFLLILRYHPVVLN